MKVAEKQGLGDSVGPGWRRARRPEQIETRRRTILAAAVRLLDRDGVEAATLSAIAREAGLSKANCYRYFESREAILLAVVLEDARGWVAEIEARLAETRGELDAVVDALVAPTVARPRLCGLISSLWSVLERNVGVEGIADFKRRFLGVSMRAIEGLQRALPSLSQDDAQRFTLFFFLFLAGSWSAANPAPVVREVLSREEFAGQCVVFEEALAAHASVMLRGLLADAG